MQLDGQPDHAAPQPTTIGLSPKTITATLVTALLGIAAALLNLVQAQPGLLGSLPVWAQTVLIASVPPVLVAVTTYQARPGTVTAETI